VHKYLLRRFLVTIPTLVGISVVLFTVLALAPGDPFEELALNPNIPAEVRLNLRHQFGLDDPIPVRYLRWLTAMLRGDWGYSFVSRVNVDSLILQRLPTTLFVLGTAYGLALLIALPVGVMSAVRPYSLFDQIATTFALVGYSLPTFFTGLLFIMLFSLYLDWLPFIYSTTIEASGMRWVAEHLRQAAMPIAVLGLFEAASLTRFVRASMLDVIHQDFVTTARAKGLTELRTILGHVLRNALIPVVTIVALQLPGIFTGAVITEQIFRVPGIGSLLISAIQSTDTPVVMAITFVYSMLVVVFNLIADIIYGFLDPRITFS
jgi:peptide/nickel transport system permease protein